MKIEIHNLSPAITKTSGGPAPTLGPLVASTLIEVSIRILKYVKKHFYLSLNP
jgi:hypothetical protein